VPVKTDNEVLSEIWLRGAMPNEISHLTGLKQFIFPPMSLTGEILPKLSRMSNLENLVLSNQNFTGSVLQFFSDDNYPSINTIELQNNKFWGTIPPSIASLTTLRTLMLAGNNITGAVPSELGDIPSFGELCC
jgi:hypothetical protein